MTPDVLLPWGKLLLLASFGFSLIRVMKGSETFVAVFEKVVVGFVALLLFGAGMTLLHGISDDLTAALARLSKSKPLKELLLDAFSRAAAEPTQSGSHTAFNLPSVIEQAWRTGVWGAMSLAVDWFFLVASFLLESAREVLWSILLLVLPLGCGVYPVFPRLLSNMVVYAIELSLWLPLLCIVELTTAHVAQGELSKSGSLGLSIVAVELLAVFLILSIPSVTHKILAGALSGDLGSQGAVLAQSRGLLMAARKWAVKV